MRASPPTFLQGFICKANTVRPYNMPGRPSGESVPKTAVHPAVQEPDARQNGCGELPAAVRRYNMPGRPSGESVPKTAVHPAVQEPDARQDGRGELPAAVRRYMSMDFSS